MRENIISKNRYKCKHNLNYILNTEDRNVRIGLSWLVIRSSGAFSEHSYEFLKKYFPFSVRLSEPKYINNQQMHFGVNGVIYSHESSG
jgi:hypothetical protein